MNKKSNIYTIILFAVSITSIATILACNRTEYQDSIKVRGESTVEIPVDYLSIQFEVSSWSSNSDEALKKNNIVVDELIAQLVQKNFDKEDILTTNIYVYPEYNYNKQPKELIGIQARSEMEVHLYEFNKFSEVAEVILTNSVDTLRRIEYVPSKDLTYYHNALNLAVADAKQKATILAESSGRTLGKTLIINEMQTNNIPLYQRTYASENEPPPNFGIKYTQTYNIMLEVIFEVK